MSDDKPEGREPLQQRIRELEDENALLRMKTRDVASANVNAAMQLVEMTEQRSRDLEAKQAETERALQLAEEASEQKSRFLATMSHELRTPISGIVGMAELLAGSDLSPAQQGRVEAISNTASSFLDLVNQLLDYSKAEAGAIEIERSELDLWRINETVAQLLQVSADAKSVDLLFDIDPDLPRLALGDSLRIRQVVLNLGVNAVKFTNRGIVSLRVKRAPDRDGATWVEWSVDDTGCGFDEDAGRRLFQPFTQADASTTRKHGGTGLGLSICRHLVECMGGSIEYSSEPGKGSSFVVSLPLAFVEEAVEPTQEHGLARIVVERPGTEDFLRAHLPRLGYRVTGPEKVGPEEAGTEEAGHADLLVVEPARDAGVAVRKLREQGCKAPIVVIDSPGEGVSEKEYASLGVLGVLQRPALPTHLSNLLRFFHRNQQSAECKPTPAFDGCRVLIAEDSAVNLRVMSERLRRIGCTVVEAVDGGEAVSEYREQEFDLIFLDCQMPVLDGYETAAEMRGIERSLGRERVPIVAVTADSSYTNEQRCYERGMDGFCVKPLRAQQIDSEMCRWLGDWARRRVR